MSNSPEIAASCLGVNVPASPFLTAGRIERINAAEYEGIEINGALRIVEPDDTVLELGAGIGIVGAVTSLHKKPKKVVSYEANPALIPYIETLYDMNGLGERNSVKNEILLSAPDRPSSMPFHLGRSFLGSSILESGTTTATSVDVPTADFNAVLESLQPTILLMDIEGGELPILDHTDLLGIRGIVIEFHPKTYGVENMRKCKNKLRTLGFVNIPDLSTRLVWCATRQI